MAAALMSGVGPGPGSAPENPRELPTLQRAWEWKGKAEQAILADGVIYVRGAGRVSALDAQDGSVLWETVCTQAEDLVGEGPVIDGGSVAVSFNGTLVLLDRRTGVIEKQVGLGTVFRMTASPLLLVVEGR
jgi:outer membrane protein assembly factor BamB